MKEGVRVECAVCILQHRVLEKSCGACALFSLLLLELLIIVSTDYRLIASSQLRSNTLSLIYGLFIYVFRSNNNNRNRVGQDIPVLAPIPVPGVDNAGGSDTDPNGRLRSVFPTTEDSRRRQYWSQSDLEGFTGTTRTDMYAQAAAKAPVSQVETCTVEVSAVFVTTAAPAGQEQKQEKEQEQEQEQKQDVASVDLQTAAHAAEADLVVSKDTPSEAELLNEFNRVAPLSLSEAERYEERITQLESAPLPCIDAVTGLVHIVGETAW